MRLRPKKTTRMQTNQLRFLSMIVVWFCFSHHFFPSLFRVFSAIQEQTNERFAINCTKNIKEREEIVNAMCCGHLAKSYWCVRLFARRFAPKWLSVFELAFVTERRMTATVFIPFELNRIELIFVNVKLWPHSTIIIIGNSARFAYDDGMCSKSVLRLKSNYFSFLHISIRYIYRSFTLCGLCISWEYRCMQSLALPHHRSMPYSCSCSDNTRNSIYNGDRNSSARTIIFDFWFE